MNKLNAKDRGQLKNQKRANGEAINLHRNESGRARRKRMEEREEREEEAQMNKVEPRAHNLIYHLSACIRNKSEDAIVWLECGFGECVALRSCGRQAARGSESLLLGHCQR